MSAIDKIQTVAFTRWVNIHLAKKGKKINDVTTDLSNGVALCQLWEALSGDKLDKWSANPKMLVHQMQNISIALAKIHTFCYSVGMKVQFTAEAINKGDKKQILGLIWVLISKFELQEMSNDDPDVKLKMMLWVNNRLQGFAGIGNFHYDFQDGFVFCALIAKFRPDLMDISSIDRENKKFNLELAFTTAETHFKIPKLLDAEDMLAGKPDEQVVMTYIVQYWKYFTNK